MSARLTADRHHDTDPGCVLHVLDHSWPVLSGYSVRSRNLITAQHSLGQNIMAVTSPLHALDDPVNEETSVDGVAYRRTAIAGLIASRALKQRWPLMREYTAVRLLRRRIMQLIDEHPVSIVYAHSPALCGLAALQAARKKGLPFAYEIRAFWEDAAVDQKRTTVRSARYHLTRGLEDYVANHADAVSAIAQPMLDDLRKRGLPAEKLFHVPNGVDAERFTPVVRDQKLARQLSVGDSVVFGFFGSLYRYEGVAWLIRAISELRSRGCACKILIIGSGEDEAAIGTAVREGNAANYVSVLPRVPHEEIKKFYSIVDVMVFPRLSVRLTELVTPLKPLEAMSLQKAVLASDVGGHRALIEAERTGLLFRSGDIADFCRQAERLVRSRELREQLGQFGRDAVLREWDWKVVAKRYQSIYDYALQRHGSGRIAFGNNGFVLSPKAGRQL